jgi:hypothetical protein
MRKSRHKLRKWKFNGMQSEIINAVIEPSFPRIDQILSQQRIALIVTT